MISSDNSENPNSLSELAILTRSDSGHMHHLSGGTGGSTGGLAPLSVTHSGGEVGSARKKLGKFSSRLVWREGGSEGEREGGREREREGGREGGRKQRMEREGGREGRRERERETDGEGREGGRK